ncbi:MAG TPA: nitroreductase family protein [Ignavibacteriaceae bacterium]|nr:nitroreductase family protein [Ignavibacteriaceae bacterium]
MDTFEAILNRRSIRKYTNEKISEEKIDKILKAAMYAPSAMNYQPWHFIVINKREAIDQIFNINPHAEMVKSAQLAIIVCGDIKLEMNIDYLVQDCSAATQNSLLAIHELGLGAVWVSSYPNKETIEGIRKYYGLPENIVPVSIISLGYPDEQVSTEDRFNKSRIHNNKW